MADAPASYSSAQKWLHWLIAAMILLIMIPAGLTMTRLGEGETTNRLYELHKSFGLIIFGLAVVRVVLRWIRGAPPVEPNVSAWQRFAAYASHYALYGLIILVPLTGWAATSAPRDGSRAGRTWPGLRRPCLSCSVGRHCRWMG